MATSINCTIHFFLFLVAKYSSETEKQYVQYYTDKTEKGVQSSCEIYGNGENYTHRQTTNIIMMNFIGSL